MIHAGWPSTLVRPKLLCKLPPREFAESHRAPCKIESYASPVHDNCAMSTTFRVAGDPFTIAAISRRNQR